MPSQTASPAANAAGAPGEPPRGRDREDDRQRTRRTADPYATAATYGFENPSTATSAPPRASSAPPRRRPRRTAPTASRSRSSPKLMRRPVSVVALEERLVEAGRLRDVVVVEIPVLVLERHVAIEPERSQVGEVLDLVGRVDPRRHGRQRGREQQNKHDELAPATGTRMRVECLHQGRDAPDSLTSCARLKPAWLTIGAIDAAAHGVEHPQTTPSSAVAMRGVEALLEVAEAEEHAEDDEPHPAPPRYCSNRCRMNPRWISSRTPPAIMHDDREDQRVAAGCAACPRADCAATLCSDGANLSDDDEHHDDEDEDGRQHGDAQERFAP